MACNTKLDVSASYECRVVCARAYWVSGEGACEVKLCFILVRGWLPQEAQVQRVPSHNLLPYHGVTMLLHGTGVCVRVCVCMGIGALPRVALACC